jgi:hypothetical protein
MDTMLKQTLQCRGWKGMVGGPLEDTTMPEVLSGQALLLKGCCFRADFLNFLYI